LFSGRGIDGEEACRIGLVHSLADDPEAAALGYFERFLAPHSASSLRFAVRAARAGFVARVAAKLSEAERSYLET